MNKGRLLETKLLELGIEVHAGVCQIYRVERQKKERNGRATPF